MRVGLSSPDHPVAHGALAVAAHRLQGCLRPADTVAALEEDEFAVVCEGVGDLSAATEIAERIVGAFAVPIRTGDGSHRVCAVVGVDLTFDSGDVPGRLLARADAALHAARRGDLGLATYAGLRAEATD